MKNLAPANRPDPIYAYHGRTEKMKVKSARDLPLFPSLAEALVYNARHWMRLLDVLAAGWPDPKADRPLLLLAVGHAIAFHTWRSLVREQGLDETSAVRLMVGMVRCSVRECAT